MADSKITELTEDTSLSITDLIATVEDPSGTPVTKKATLLTLQKLLLADGWTPALDTWTYASASTFTIAGVDRTAIFTKGTRLKFTQTSTKYAVVVSSTFSTNTTVTIAVNTDYTIANAAITSPYYSYSANPQGYTTTFNWTPTWGGFSVNPTGTFKYSILGNTCTMFYADASAGTSNSTELTFTVPVACLSGFASIGYPCFITDNGSNSTTPGHLVMSSGSATVNARKSFYNAAWTNSGAKQFYIGSFTYIF